MQSGVTYIHGHSPEVTKLEFVRIILRYKDLETTICQMKNVVE